MPPKKLKLKIKKKKKKKEDSWFGLSGRMQALQSQGPEFKPQSHQKKKVKIR
jgi:hypothetical protein